MNESKTEAIKCLDLLKRTLNSACAESEQKVSEIYKKENLTKRGSQITDGEGNAGEFWTSFEDLRSNHTDRIDDVKDSIEAGISVLKKLFEKDNK